MSEFVAKPPLPISASSKAREALKSSSSSTKEPKPAATDLRSGNPTLASREGSGTPVAKPITASSRARDLLKKSPEMSSAAEVYLEATPSTSDLLDGMLRNISKSEPTDGVSVSGPKLYNAKICFLMDVTGSMEPQKDAVKEKIFDIIDEALRVFPQVGIKMAFVGYRDVGDVKRVEIIQFSHDPEHFTMQLVDVLCYGGGDEAEDVLGGMEAAITQLDWGDARIKIVFHIGDAPHHGISFHDIGICDDHPELEHSPRRYDSILADYADMHIDYYFATIRDKRGKVTTRKMAKMFKKAYDSYQSRRNPLEIVDLTDFSADKLFATVLSGLATSIISFLKKH